MGFKCKFYHGSYAELNKYKATEYVEVKETKAPAKPSKAKNKKYVNLRHIHEYLCIKNLPKIGLSWL
jgi:hypothetical protein